MDRSGLTPIQPRPPGQRLSDSEKVIEDYQRQKFKGLTTRELQEAGCLNKEIILPGDLSNDVHPLYEQDRWVPREKDLDLVMNGENKGKLNGRNEIVWNALLPSIRPASRIIAASKMWIW